MLAKRLESRTGPKNAEAQKERWDNRNIPTDKQEERERRVERGTKEGGGEATERESGAEPSRRVESRLRRALLVAHPGTPILCVLSPG